MKKRSCVFTAVSVILILSVLFLTACGNGEKQDKQQDETTVQPITEALIQTEKVSENDAVTHTAEETVTESVTDEEALFSQAEETTVKVPSTVDEIVAYFNESANKIKPNAKKIVKNYEKRIVNEDKLDIPDALESTARTMMTTLMKDDTDPIVYETREDITNEFLVPAQSYVSVLKPEYVESAVCTDKGDEYIIHIRLKDSKNPTAGNGVGSVCDVIETGEVAEKASFIKDFSTQYYNCEVTATVDKATGNVTHMVYVTPVVLALTVDMFGTHNGQVGFTFEKDYSITY